MGTHREHKEWIDLQDVARLESADYQTLKKRFQRAHILMRTNPEDARRRQAPITVLSDGARRTWLEEQILHAQQPKEPGDKNSETTHSLAPAGPAEKGPKNGDPVTALAPAGASSLQPLLPFAPIPKDEAAIRNALAGVSEKDMPYLAPWMDIIGLSENGTWRKLKGQYIDFKDGTQLLINNAHDFICAQGKLRGISVSNIYAKLKIARRIWVDSSIPQDLKWKATLEALRPKLRPGRSNDSFFADPEHLWMRAYLGSIYLTEAKLNMRVAHRLLLNEIEQKQGAWGPGHYYARPTYRQVQTELNRISPVERDYAREGEKAYYNRYSLYISRRSPAHSNLIWVTDQRLANVRVQDSGHRLGRIWTVNFLDVASFKWLGGAYGPVLSSDTVMRAAAEAIGQAGVPIAIHHDQGKEFKGRRFTGGFFTIKGEDLFKEAMGLWERLGVKPVGAIGRNPRSKTIERWHAEVDEFDKSFPTWCGGNPHERPEKLAEIEAQHKAWMRAQAEDPRIPSIEEYIARFREWCVKTWNCETRSYGKYLCGMTPEEAYNTKLPPEGVRMLGASELDFYTQDRREATIAQGGQINLTFHGYRVEYIAPELFLRQGEDVEAVISRQTYQYITVIYRVPGGTETCEARAKDIYNWLPEGEDAQENLRAAIREEHRAKRTVKAGVKAWKRLAESSNPMDLLESSPERPFGATAAPAATVPAATHTLPGNVCATQRPEPESEGPKALTFVDAPDWEADEPEPRKGLNFADVE